MELKVLSSLLVLLRAVQLCAASVIPGQKVIGDSNENFDSILKSLKKADIIDTVVDDFTPKCFISPYYSEETKPVDLGNTLKPKNTKKKPTLKIFCPGMGETTGLTVVLTDPDAPSREDPKWGEMCHWIAITSGYAFNLELSSGEVGTDIIEYKPPGPPPKTGYHRYVFLLLEGDNSNLTAPEDRRHWGTGKKGHGVRDWAQKESLQVIGANFFYEENKKQ